MKKARLLSVVLVAVLLVCSTMSVMPVMSESNQSTRLNVLSANSPLQDGWYLNNGYTLSYWDTGADYFWGDSTTTGYDAAATAITDEGNAFNTTVVNGSGSAPANRPDLQDGGIGVGGNYSANTGWDKVSVAVVWDLKEQYDLTGLDIVNHVEGSNHKLYKVQAWGRNDPSEAWTTITGNLTGLESTAMTWPTTSSAEIYRFNLSGTYRYLRVDMWTHGHQIHVEEMYIFGDSVEETGEETELNVLTNNAKLSSGWYIDRGYDFTYLNTSADYLWTNEYGGNTTSVSDEQTTLNTPIKPTGSETQNLPNLQDGINNANDYAVETLPWESNRVSVVWDLKKPYQVDRLDIIRNSEQNNDNYSLSQVVIYGRSSEEDAWTQISQGQGLYPHSYRYNSDNMRNMFLLDGEAYRYIRVDMTAVHQVNLTEMYIFGDEVETTALNVLTANERLESGAYADSGYTLTYLNTAADYMWTNEYGGNATSVSDEQHVFDTTIVSSSSDPNNTTYRPDLQDGIIGGGADFAANTNWHSTEPYLSKVSVVWDLKATYEVDRLDIIRKLDQNTPSNYRLQNVKVYGKEKGTDAWEYIGSWASPNTLSWSNDAKFNQFDLNGGQYRFIRIDMAAENQVYLEEMYIFGQSIEQEEPLFPCSFAASEYYIFDVEAEETATLANADIVSVVGSIVNETDTAVTGNVFTAIYSGDKMMFVLKSDPVTVSANGTQEWENTLMDLGGLPQNARLVNCFWNSDQQPLADKQPK